MRQIGNTGALLLFDISSFFENVNPNRATQIFQQKGFPDNVCQWTHSFLINHTVTLKMGKTLSDPCHIHNGMPQGSPLSPILSALYTVSLLDLAAQWTHHDLMLYINDSTIFTMFRTTKAAMESMVQGFEQALM
jgi:hypothetical protein